MTISVDELKERVRQSRIGRGLTPDPPKRKRNLSDDLALVLLDRMDTFVEACVEIARLYRADHFVVIDTDRFSHYAKCARLLTRAEDFRIAHVGYKTCLILAIIKQINEQIAENPEDIANDRMLHYFYKDVMEISRKLPSAKGSLKHEIRRRANESNR